MIFGWCFFLLLKRCFIYGIILWLLGFSCRRCWKVKILVLWSSPSLDAETPTTLPRSFSHSEKFNVVNAMQWWFLYHVMAMRIIICYLKPHVLFEVRFSDIMGKWGKEVDKCLNRCDIIYIILYLSNAQCAFWVVCLPSNRTSRDKYMLNNLSRRIF